MWSVTVLGTLNGIVLGCLVEALIHAYVWFVNRRMRELARASNEIFCPIEYPPHWWVTPCIFMFAFAGSSIVVHRFWLAPVPSVTRLWQKIGLVGSGALMLYAVAYDVIVRMVFSSATVAIYAGLFILAAGFNYLFGMFVRLAADYVARIKKTSLP
jgi:hypothetical protein